MSPLFSWRKAITVSGVAPTTRHVALTLSLHMNDVGGSCFPSQTTLAAETGLSRSTINEHLGKLLDAGLLMVGHRRRSSDGRQSSNEYAATIPAHLIEVMEGESRTGTTTKWMKPRVPEADTAPRGSGTPPDREADTKRASREGVIEDANTSPTPPEEGEQPELFAGADRGATTRAETKQRKATKASAVSGIFDPLWDRYPRSKGRSIGSKPAALRALTKALKQESSAEILARIDFYALARNAYYEIHQIPAPLMNASTFFNGKHEQWDHEWDREDLEYWPAPAGREWGTPRRRSVEEILASAGGG